MEEFNCYLFSNKYGERFIFYECPNGNKIIDDFSKIPYTADTLLEDMMEGLRAFPWAKEQTKHVWNEKAVLLGLSWYDTIEDWCESYYLKSSFSQLFSMMSSEKSVYCEFNTINVDWQDFLLFCDLRNIIKSYCSKKDLELCIWEDAMEICEFVNSGDIRKHWEKISYEPTPLESAWLIWQSKNHTLKEKHAAYWEIIDTTEDCPIPAGLHDIPQDSLHAFLERYMELELTLISKFYEDEPNTVYSYRFYCEGDENWVEESALFSTFEEMYKVARDEDWDFSPKFFEYVKIYVGKDNKRIRIRKTYEDNQIIRVEEDRYWNCKNEEGYLTEGANDIFEEVWEGMWFRFPTPFKKGDIVETVYGKYCKPSCLDGTFALTSICTESDCTDYLAEKGDGNDMTAHGYFVGKFGEIYHECIHNYMNLEYVCHNLRREDRLLIPISNYLKGEIDLALLLGAQRIILCEEEAQTERNLLNYTKDGLKLAGMENWI